MRGCRPYASENPGYDRGSQSGSHVGADALQAFRCFLQLSRQDFVFQLLRVELSAKLRVRLVHGMAEGKLLDELRSCGAVPRIGVSHEPQQQLQISGKRRQSIEDAVAKSVPLRAVQRELAGRHALVDGESESEYVRFGEMTKILLKNFSGKIPTIAFLHLRI